METISTQTTESFRFMVSSRYNINGKKLSLELMAPSEEHARKLACAFNPTFALLATRDVLVTKLFQPLRNIVNLKHQKYGICFYKTKLKNGTYRDHYCIMDENMNALICGSNHTLVLRQLRKMNPNLHNYSPNLLPQPPRFMPVAENGKVFIADYVEGQKIPVGTYQETVPREKQSNVTELLGADVLVKCLQMNRMSAA